VTQSKKKFETRKLPMMPIRDVVTFPSMMTPFVVGRESSVLNPSECGRPPNVLCRTNCLVSQTLRGPDMKC